MKNLFARLFGGSPSFASITADLDRVRARLEDHVERKRDEQERHRLEALAHTIKSDADGQEADKAKAAAGNLAKLLGA